MEDLELDLQTPEINVELGQNLIEIELPGGARGLKGDDGEPGPEGPQGPQGERGSSGVWVGPNNPPDDSYNVWIDSDGEESTIPTKISQLENDKGFITNEVDNLINYPTNEELDEIRDDLDNRKANANDLDTTNQNVGINTNRIITAEGEIENIKDAIDYDHLEPGDVFVKERDLSTVAKTNNYYDLINIPTKTYGLPNTSTSQWIKIGTVKLAAQPHQAIIKIYDGDGQNARADQNMSMEIIIKRGWQSSPSTTGLAGVSYKINKFVANSNVSDIKVLVLCKDTSANFDVYVYFPWGYSAGFYSITGQYSSYTHSGTAVGTTKPTDGVEQPCEGSVYERKLEAEKPRAETIDANTSHTYENNKSHMTLLTVTNAMTSNKPGGDGFILNFDWDNSNHYAGQLYIPNTKSTSRVPQFRGCSAGSWEDSWKDFALISSGTTDGWQWVKVGKTCLCWKYLSVNVPANGFTQWGAIYSRDLVFAAQTYPFTFTSDPMIGITPMRGTGTGAPNFWIFTGNPPSNIRTTTPDYGIARGSNFTVAANVRAVMYAIGMV